MKREEKKTLSQKPSEELESLLVKKQEESELEKIAALGKKSKNVKMVKNLKLEIARLKTWIRETELKGVGKGQEELVLSEVEG